MNIEQLESLGWKKKRLKHLDKGIIEYYRYGNLTLDPETGRIIITDPSLCDDNYDFESFHVKSFEELKVLMPYLKKYEKTTREFTLKDSSTLFEDRGVYRVQLVTPNPSTSFLPSSYNNKSFTFYNFDKNNKWFTEPVEVQFSKRDTADKLGMDGSYFEIEVVWGKCKVGDILQHQKIKIFIVEKIRNF